MTRPYKHTQAIYARARLSNVWTHVLVLIALALSTGCGTRPPDWPPEVKNGPSTLVQAPQSIATTNELIVYLDESGSMAGYVSRDGKTIFGKTLRELRFATGTFAGPDVRVSVRRVGSAIGPPLPDMDLTTASQDPSVYRAGETNLSGAISAFKVGYQPNGTQLKQSATPTRSNGTDSPEPPPPARFQILVTDGVQSTRRGDTNQNCNAGSDQFCVRQKIAELLKAGWGGCVLGVRADFRGTVYSEVSGAAIPYETRNNNPSSFRPFFLYIFSPDQVALDSLVRSLKERLRPLVDNCSECIRELNLSFPYTDAAAEFEISIPKESRSALHKAKNQGGPPPRFTMQVDVDTERSGPKPFTIQVKVPWSSHALDATNQPELVKLIKWELKPIHPAPDSKSGARFPEVNITGAHLESSHLVLKATASYSPGTGEPSWRFYSVEGRVNLNQGTPEWIKSWSTDLDTTPETANRTFNLETALLGLWNNSTAKDQVVAKAYLRIGPSN